jgi:hypothetical protein
MNAEHDDLASAYLDGELTDEERRIAEGDPAVMAEVEQLRALRDELIATDPPTDVVRATAIAAAMDAFSLPLEPPASEPASFWRSSRWLGVAAAVLVIGVLGLVVAIAGGGQDDNDSAEPGADSDIAAEEPAAMEVAAEEPAAEDDVARTTTAAAEALADEAPVEVFVTEEPAAEEPAADAPAAEEPAEEPASEEPASTGGAVDAPAHLDGLPITTPTELAAVGQYLLDLIEARQLPPTPEHSCPFSDVLADGVYVLDGPTDVYIAVDPAERRVIAIEQATCVLVVETPLP